MRALKAMKSWCELNGKTLHLLANSACLADCPFRTEHYCIVSHTAEIAKSLAAEGIDLEERIHDTVPCQLVRDGN